jgi:3-methyladenine DNA glycosylase AlkD
MMKRTEKQGISFDPVADVALRMDALERSGKKTTAGIRKISASCYKNLSRPSIDQVLALGEELLEMRRWSLSVVAYDWAFRMRKHYQKDHFDTFDRWLKTYIQGWGDCDDFCTHAFGELLGQYPDLFENILEWTEDPNWCVRRAAAVVLIYPIKKNRLGNIGPLQVAEKLLNDQHDLVRKGYGWMLKIYAASSPKAVRDYLINRCKVMPRVAFRYALEGFDPDTRKELMACK